jgi:triosephosphate isomerase (TIM)
MKRPVFAGNWKMHHGPSSARAFVERFLLRFTPRDDRSVVIFPPAPSIEAVSELVRMRADVGVGIQNIWHEDKGAFTGESSAVIAKEAGAQYALVGHSERRHVFGETDAKTAHKCAAAARNGLTPILCVGELAAEREVGETNEVVLRQLNVGILELSPDVIATMAFAYEPVWAIGTGHNARPEDASAVHAVMRAALHERVGQRAEEIPILYGGSVSVANASSLLAAPGVDGLLVGGASLDPETWATICTT